MEMAVSNKKLNHPRLVGLVVLVFAGIPLFSILSLLFVDRDWIHDTTFRPNDWLTLHAFSFSRIPEADLGEGLIRYSVTGNVQEALKGFSPAQADEIRTKFLPGIKKTGVFGNLTGIHWLSMEELKPGRSHRQAKELLFYADFQKASEKVAIGIHRGKGGFELDSFHSDPIGLPFADSIGFDFRGRSPLQYLYLFTCFFLFCLTGLTLALCAESDVKRKWLWMLFILLGIGSFGILWTNPAAYERGWSNRWLYFKVFNSGVGTVDPISGPWMFDLSIPLGTLLFLVLYGRDFLKKHRMAVLAVTGSYLLLSLALSLYGLSSEPVERIIDDPSGVGDSPKLYDQGLAYYEGKGVAKDLEKARELIEEAALMGLRDAQKDMGNFYYQGVGTPVDYSKALKWYRRAALWGSSQASYNLGVMYAKGQGVPIDGVESYKWFHLAMDEGDPDAKGLLDELEKQMDASDVEKAKDQAERMRPLEG